MGYGMGLKRSEESTASRSSRLGLQSVAARPFSISVRFPENPVPGTSCDLWREMDVFLTVTQAKFYVGSTDPFKMGEEARQTTRAGIYYVGSSGVRAAGVHQLRIRNTQAVEAPASAGGESMRFPFATSADSGEQFGAMTLGYVGSTERGGEISGLPSGDYPYRKVGDSVKWSGQLRPDIGVTYNLRMVNFASGSAQLGGVAVVTLP